MLLGPIALIKRGEGVTGFIGVFPSERFRPIFIRPNSEPRFGDMTFDVLIDYPRPKIYNFSNLFPFSSVANNSLPDRVEKAEAISDRCPCVGDISR